MLYYWAISIWDGREKLNKKILFVAVSINESCERLHIADALPIQTQIVWICTYTNTETYIWLLQSFLEVSFEYVGHQVILDFLFEKRKGKSTRKWMEDSSYTNNSIFIFPWIFFNFHIVLILILISNATNFISCLGPCTLKILYN